MLPRARSLGWHGLQTLTPPVPFWSPIEHDLFAIFSDANETTEQKNDLQLDLKAHKKNQLAWLRGKPRYGWNRGQPSQLGLSEIARSGFTPWKSHQPKILKGQTTPNQQRNEPVATRCWQVCSLVLDGNAHDFDLFKLRDNQLWPVSVKFDFAFNS